MENGKMVKWKNQFKRKICSMENQLNRKIN